MRTESLSPGYHVRSFIVLLCAFGCMYGCSGSAPTLLDNHGGLSHGGRRIALHPDGRYTDTIYTDNPGDERVTRGAYSLDAAVSHLTLTPEEAPAEHLYRVDYHGQQYWVRDQDRRRIPRPGDSDLRKISLRAGTQ